MPKNRKYSLTGKYLSIIAILLLGSYINTNGNEITNNLSQIEKIKRLEKNNNNVELAEYLNSSGINYWRSG
ncbi:hypothetical protein ACFLTE_08465, partial [Bacteroidota bacterium]